MEGQYPQELSALTAGGKYLQALPEVGPQNVHPPSAAVHNGTKPTDAGGWLYVNDAANANAGSVMINCTHRREGVRVARVLTAALLH